MSAFPTKITRVGDNALRIAWSDGTWREYTFRELRDHCPCATCRETHGPAAAPAAPANPFQILKPAEARPLMVEGMKPVGQYAYSIEFSDGHDTGIYTFDVLRTLGREIPSDADSA